MWHTFEGHVHQRTQKGVLFQSHFWDAPMWFPTSQSYSQQDGEDTVVFRVKSWLAGKKDLEEFTYYDAETIERIGAR